MTDTISRHVYIISSTLSRLVESNGTFKQDRGANPETRGSVSWEGTNTRGGIRAKKAKHVLMRVSSEVCYSPVALLNALCGNNDYKL